MAANQKSFDLVNRISKSFSLFIYEFQYATTLIFRIRDSIEFTFVSSSIGKMISIINLRKVSLVISQMKLTANMVQTINAKRVSIVYAMKQRMKAVVTMGTINTILFVSKARQSIVSIVSHGLLTLTISVILATFFTLGNHDAETLGTLDLETLGEMDYIAA